MTEEEIFDVFLGELDELHGFCQKLFGKESEVSQKFTELFNLADRTAKDWLATAWNTTEAEEYRAAHMPELARLAQAHNSNLRRSHGEV
jgi:hypothetical protein